LLQVGVSYTSGSSGMGGDLGGKDWGDGPPKI